MLDDSNYFKNADPYCILGNLEKIGDQLTKNSYQLQFDLPDVEQIIIVAKSPMSKIAANLCQTTFLPNLKIVATKDDLPAWLNQQTLVILILDQDSNLEIEKVSLKILKTKAKLVIIGEQTDKLDDFVFAQKINYLKLADDLSLFKSLILYQALVFIVAQIDKEDQIIKFKKAIDNLRPAILNWSSTTPTKNNLAKQLAYEIIGKTPLIYTQPALLTAASHWELSYNKLMHQLTQTASYTLANQNEFDAWIKKQPLDKNYIVFYLSIFSETKEEATFKKMSQALSGQIPQAHLIAAKGSSYLEQVLWLILLANFTFLYVALLNNVKIKN